jgi:hypothetical protein
VIVLPSAARAPAFGDPGSGAPGGSVGGSAPSEPGPGRGTWAYGPDGISDPPPAIAGDGGEAIGPDGATTPGGGAAGRPGLEGAVSALPQLRQNFIPGGFSP